MSLKFLVHLELGRLPWRKFCLGLEFVLVSLMVGVVE